MNRTIGGFTVSTVIRQRSHTEFNSRGKCLIQESRLRNLISFIKDFRYAAFFEFLCKPIKRFSLICQISIAYISCCPTALQISFLHRLQIVWVHENKRDGRF